MGAARVEVLVRQQAFKPKANVEGDIIKGASAKSYPSCFTILYYTILYYTILYYTILYYTILHYTILYYTYLYYTILVTILY